MEIRIKQTGTVVTEGEFRSMFPDASLPLTLTLQEVTSLGGDIVLEGPQAQPTRYQVSFRNGVQEIDGQWFTKYSVADMDDEAKAAKDVEQAKSVRKQRDDLLLGTDWKVIKAAETSIVLAADWTTYRQALRDITTQQGFPWEVQWPEQPTQ
jgi:predicted component of type VI protein secretion system